MHHCYRLFTSINSHLYILAHFKNQSYKNKNPILQIEILGKFEHSQHVVTAVYLLFDWIKSRKHFNLNTINS